MEKHRGQDLELLLTGWVTLRPCPNGLTLKNTALPVFPDLSVTDADVWCIRCKEDVRCQAWLLALLDLINARTWVSGQPDERAFCGSCWACGDFAEPGMHTVNTQPDHQWPTHPTHIVLLFCRPAVQL